MSRWNTIKYTSNSNFRKFLKERIEKANSCAKLTAVVIIRLSKLESIADKLKRGENVQNCHLKTWLSDEEYEQPPLETHQTDSALGIRAFLIRTIY